MKLVKSRKGFSLIEILTVVAAIGVLGAATFGIVSGINSAIKKSKATDVARQLQTLASQAAASQGVTVLDATDFGLLSSAGVTVTIAGSPVVFKLQTAPDSSLGTFSYNTTTGLVTSSLAP